MVLIESLINRIIVFKSISLYFLEYDHVYHCHKTYQDDSGNLTILLIHIPQVKCNKCVSTKLNQIYL